MSASVISLQAWVEDCASLSDGTLPVQLNLTRHDLADIFAAVGFTKGAEIGVEQGRYAEVLCRANSVLELLCVDAWQASNTYRPHVTQAQVNGFYLATQQRLQPYHATCLRAFSVDAARAVPDSSLDFVYLDAAHDFANVAADMAAWAPKVRAGGIVSGHDFTTRQTGDPCHVEAAVTAWTQAYQIRPWFVLTGDRSPSWFWLQP